MLLNILLLLNVFVEIMLLEQVSMVETRVLLLSNGQSIMARWNIHEQQMSQINIIFLSLSFFQTSPNM